MDRTLDLGDTQEDIKSIKSTTFQGSRIRVGYEAFNKEMTAPSSRHTIPTQQDYALYDCVLERFNLGRTKVRNNMGISTINMENLSPKTKMMMEYMKKLEEKIDILGGGLESIKLDTQSVNAKRSLHKITKMYQGSRSMEEYFKEIEVTLIRAQVIKSQEATMARFLHGLNREIQDVVIL
ncbi:hypothetical protein CR513_33702, partial [Mucuna pruriens]